MADLVLVLEASAGSGSLALLQGTGVVAEAAVPMRGHDGERLMPALVQLLSDSDVSTHDVQRVVCGSGPGGFTSLRIAAAIAKGLAESLGVALWSVSSLALLAAGVRREGGEGRLASESDGASNEGAPLRAAPGRPDVLAVLDAMRGEWYTQRFGFAADGSVLAVGEAVRLDRAAIEREAANGAAQVVGVGGESFTGGRQATPAARDTALLHKGPLLHPVDVARWEPDYGRLAEAQVKWEQAHGRALEVGG
jgi:tRNA threonylcarbamoyladenosine biosynthesis protein TsaB